MPRLTIQCPKYRRHKVRNLAFVVLSGQKIYLGQWQSAQSLKLYDKLLSVWLQNGRQSTVELLHQSGTASMELEAATPLTVQQVADQYNEHARTYYRKAGQITREAGCIRESLKMVCTLYGDTPANAFGPARLKQVRQAMIEADWSRIYINKQVDRVRRAFAWAVEQELLEAGPKYRALRDVRSLAKGRSQARETAPVQPVSDEQVHETLKHLPPILGDMVRLQRLTGMRPSEVCAITPEAIDRSGDVWLYHVNGHKTEHLANERVVAIGPQAQSVLRQYLLRPANQPCFSPREAEARRRAEQHARRQTPLSCGNKPGSKSQAGVGRKLGHCYTRDSYRRAIHRVCKKNRLNPWHPNQLRHTRATEVRRAMGLEAAQCTLGHTNAQVTQLYAERNLQLAVEVARQSG